MHHPSPKCVHLITHMGVAQDVDVVRTSGEALRWFHLAIIMPDDLGKEHIARAEKAGRYWSFLCKSKIIGASRSEPHTNHSYEKIAVPMYVCMYVCMYV